MPGQLVAKTWQYDPTLDAPAAYRRACSYEAFIPTELASLELRLDARLAGLVSEAEHAVRQLNDEGGAALGPVSRLLLRTESIASSKVEGMQLGVRELARAEAKAESGIAPGSTAREVLANIDAMVLAMDEATEVETFREHEVLAIHRRLLERAPHKHIAGRLRVVHRRAHAISWRRRRRLDRTLCVGDDPGGATRARVCHRGRRPSGALARATARNGESAARRRRAVGNHRSPARTPDDLGARCRGGHEPSKEPHLRSDSAARRRGSSVSVVRREAQSVVGGGGAARPRRAVGIWRTAAGIRGRLFMRR